MAALLRIALGAFVLTATPAYAQFGGLVKKAAEAVVKKNVPASDSAAAKQAGQSAAAAPASASPSTRRSQLDEENRLRGLKYAEMNSKLDRSWDKRMWAPETRVPISAANLDRLEKALAAERAALLASAKSMDAIDAAPLVESIELWYRRDSLAVLLSTVKKENAAIFEAHIQWGLCHGLAESTVDNSDEDKEAPTPPGLIRRMEKMTEKERAAFEDRMIHLSAALLKAEETKDARMQGIYVDSMAKLTGMRPAEITRERPANSRKAARPKPRVKDCGSKPDSSRAVDADAIERELQRVGRRIKELDSVMQTHAGMEFRQLVGRPADSVGVVVAGYSIAQYRTLRSDVYMAIRAKGTGQKLELSASEVELVWGRMDRLARYAEQLGVPINWGLWKMRGRYIEEG